MDAWDTDMTRYGYEKMDRIRYVYGGMTNPKKLGL